jgi:SPP1 family phage portal protein
MIDAYDATTSDTSSELLQMRMSYLLVAGGDKMDAADAQEFNESLKATGTLHVSEGASASFLQKTLDMNSTITFLSMLESNIYRFCSAINYSKDTMSGGQLTGVALRQRLQSIQNSCAKTWLSFSDSLDQQWQMLSNWLELTSGRPLDVQAITQKVTYNIPIDIAEYINQATQLMNLGLPREVYLSVLPQFESQAELEKVIVMMDRDGSMVTDLESEVGFL